MIGTALARLRSLVVAILQDPGQVKFVPRWLRSLRHSTLESRLPWLPFRVLERLEPVLDRREASVFEFGGGGSTTWFFDRGATVITVEHDKQWYDALHESLGSLPRVDLRFAPGDNDFADYVSSIAAQPDSSLDVVVVDGRERVRCLVAATSKVRPGGLLILDDTDRERYQPAFEAVDWPSVTYRGLTPSKKRPGVTTVWQRPGS